jgi:putative molybdopterin biosynthesis protein
VSAARRYLTRTPLAEARRLLADRLGESWAAPAEIVPAAGALGRVLAAAVGARHSVPAYHAAAMDGFAVRASTTYEAAESRPVDLPLGTAALPVDTGDPLPPGTDAVLMVEDAHFLEGAVRVRRSLSPYENVRTTGEDVVAGELVVPPGKTVTPADIGLCLAAGVTELPVRRRPRVAIIPTGDELVPPGREPGPGEIVESNSGLLAAMVEERGGEPLVVPIVRDRREDILAALRGALESADLVAVNAGSSAGRDDHTASVIGELGELLVHGLAVQPGKPTAVGVALGKPVIGLPGYSAAALTVTELLLLPLVDRFLGREEPDRRTRAAVSRDLPSRPGSEEFVRGQAAPVAGRLVFNPLPRGASLVSSCSRANAVAELPAACEGVEAGGEVTVRPLVPAGEMERSLLLAGSNDLSLEVLRGELLRGPGRVNLLISTQGSLGGLVSLAGGYAHLATCHLLDPASGDYNLPWVERMLPGRRVRLLRVALREQGLMVARGNPRGVRGLPDLAGGGVRFVNRQRGSGTRILLDYLLAAERIDPAGIAGYDREEITHLTVAVAVAGGMADAGMGVLPAALALGLDFIPLASEPFDLVIPEESAAAPPLERVREIVASARFRSALDRLGGYDTSVSGDLLVP